MEKGIIPANQITSKLLTEILSQYFVDPKILSFRVVKFGIENQNIAVRLNHNQYVIRIYNQFQFGMFRRTKSSILWELDLMKQMGGEGIPVPKIIETLRRRLLTQINLAGKKYFVLVTEYVEGKHVKKLSPQQLKEIVYWQARLHQVARGVNSVGNREHLSQFGFEKSLSECLDKKIDQYPKHKVMLTELQVMIEKLFPQLLKLIRGRKAVPIHNDLNRENFKFVGDKVVGIFDFDDALMGVPIVELGKTLSFVLDKSVSPKRLDRTIDQQLKNYGKIVKTSQRDCQIVKLAFLIVWGARKLFYFKGTGDDLKTSQACLQYYRYLLGIKKPLGSSG